MKIGIAEGGDGLELSEVYNGIGIRTNAGTYSIAQRDGGIEIRLGDGPWYAWNNADGPHVLPGQDKHHD